MYDTQDYSPNDELIFRAMEGKLRYAFHWFDVVSVNRVYYNPQKTR